jgi:agmatine deiminase
LVISRTTQVAAANTPAELGYRMPAEWEPHSATWLAWPHYRADWPGKFQPIPWVFAEIVRYLSRNERVELLVRDEAEEKVARKVLGYAGIVHTSENHGTAKTGVCFHRWPTDRIWTRDYGAIFVRREKDGDDAAPQFSLGATNWKFNAWAKYPNSKNDDRIAGRITKLVKVPEWQPTFELGRKPIRVVLEGGSIDVNGRGTLITTEECLLSDIQQRNPGLSREDIEKVFADYLGVTNVIWLGKGIAGDDTHGHVDDITRFVAPNTVVTVVEPNVDDPNHAPLRENLATLRRATDQDGRRLKVIELPMPAPVYFRGQRLPASYANFYIANGVVLVPVFNDPNDRMALNILADLFPDREVVGIACRDFIWGLGAIHCMTQQQPAG